MVQLLVLAISLLQGAQPVTTLSGVVTKAENGQPLAGAIVVIDELRRETHTADDGSYRFDRLPPGQYHVGVRAVGYSTRRIEVTVGRTPATVNLSIEYDLRFAEVLSVSPTARPQFESYQPTTVLDGQELTKNLESTIGATLAEAPGVSMREFGAAPARPIIRGLDGDRISVLEDGQRMGDLSSQSGDHAVPANPAAARKIEVVRGPATLLYGANAIGGLVNVITDSIPAERMSGVAGNLTFNFGTNGSAAGGAGDVHIGNGTYALHVGGAGNRSGDYDTPLGDVGNSQARTSLAQIGVSRTGEKHYAGASYGYDNSKYGIPIVEAGTVQLTPKRHSMSARAGGQNLAGWVQSYRATLGVRKYQHDELAGSAVERTFQNNTIEGEALVSHRRTGVIVGSLGGWFMGRDFEAPAADALTPGVRQRAAAAFVYEEIESPHAAFQFGGRFDHSRFDPDLDRRIRTFNEWSASMGAVWKPIAAKDHVAIAINLARASRYPSLEELYYFGRHPGNLAFEIGNDELDAEHGIGVDLSVRGRGPRVEGEITYFRNDIDNYIFRQPTGEVHDSFPVVRNIEVDSVLSGVEADGRVQLLPELTVDLAYDMVRGELKDGGGPLPRIPPHRVRAGITYRKNAFQAGGSAQLVGDQTRVFGEELPTEGYTTVKLFTSYSFEKNGFRNTITARLDNATDKL